MIVRYTNIRGNRSLNLNIPRCVDTFEGEELEGYLRS